MSQLRYAMDTCFYGPLGYHPFAQRCAMTRELGFDATYLTLWSEEAWRDAEQRLHLPAEHGLACCAIYCMLDIAQGPAQDEVQRLLQLLPSLAADCELELALNCRAEGAACSDPEYDDQAVVLLETLLAAAEQQNRRICLYPHISSWLERIEDAARLCARMEHPLLRAMFCGFHWYTVDGQDLDASLAAAAPWLHAANLSGSRQLAPGRRCTIEPLDQGELDNFMVLARLRAHGFTGRIGVQGYGIGGDVYAHLRRSRQALDDMLARLEAHPDWATINTERKVRMPWLEDPKPS